MAEVSFPSQVLRGCGIDVHLKVVVATIKGEGIRKETRSFDTFTSSFDRTERMAIAERHYPRGNGEYGSLLEARVPRTRRCDTECLDSERPSH